MPTSVFVRTLPIESLSDGLRVVRRRHIYRIVVDYCKASRAPPILRQRFQALSARFAHVSRPACAAARINLSKNSHFPVMEDGFFDVYNSEEIRQGVNTSGSTGYDAFESGGIRPRNTSTLALSIWNARQGVDFEYGVWCTAADRTSTLARRPETLSYYPFHRPVTITTVGILTTASFVDNVGLPTPYVSSTFSPLYQADRWALDNILDFYSRLPQGCSPHRAPESDIYVDRYIPYDSSETSASFRPFDAVFDGRPGYLRGGLVEAMPRINPAELRRRDIVVYATSVERFWMPQSDKSWSWIARLKLDSITLLQHERREFPLGIPREVKSESKLKQVHQALDWTNSYVLVFDLVKSSERANCGNDSLTSLSKASVHEIQGPGTIYYEDRRGLRTGTGGKEFPRKFDDRAHSNAVHHLKSSMHSYAIQQLCLLPTPSSPLASRSSLDGLPFDVDGIGGAVPIFPSSVTRGIPPSSSLDGEPRDGNDDISIHEVLLGKECQESGLINNASSSFHSTARGLLITHWNTSTATLPRSKKHPNTPGWRHKHSSTTRSYNISHVAMSISKELEYYRDVGSAVFQGGLYPRNSEAKPNRSLGLSIQEMTVDGTPHPSSSPLYEWKDSKTTFDDSVVELLYSHGRDQPLRIWMVGAIEDHDIRYLGRSTGYAFTNMRPLYGDSLRGANEVLAHWTSEEDMNFQPYANDGASLSRWSKFPTRRLFDARNIDNPLHSQDFLVDSDFRKGDLVLQECMLKRFPAMAWKTQHIVTNTRSCAFASCRPAQPKCDDFVPAWETPSMSCECQIKSCPFREEFNFTGIDGAPGVAIVGHDSTVLSYPRFAMVGGHHSNFLFQTYIHAMA
ncbi:hypothetical protein BV25DRAFT_1835451 [Artomyces pyxidatus]|uniref:Uncharacterized protein n=1 Tax=Artomyces pyxidatus TaxID=48021 RepID=A0ACB8TFC3_9AGAM|nr:hypothetical protein BV25DRAFT_1835451 [Artomyces pyxidatus]